MFCLANTFWAEAIYEAFFLSKGLKKVGEEIQVIYKYILCLYIIMEVLSSISIYPQENWGPELSEAEKGKTVHSY